MRNRIPFTYGRVFAAALALCPVVALAAPVQSLPDRFTLGRYVPGDWWMYLHVAHNPEREWLDKEWADVWDALKKTGLDKDVLTLVTSILNDEERAKTEATITKVKELLDGVRWGELAAREFVLAERIAPPFPEYALLFRGTEGSAEKNIRGLADVLQYLTSFSPMLQLVQEKKNDVDVWVLRVGAAPFAVHLFRKGDIIALVTHETAFNQMIGLMAGDGKKSIVDAPRFQEAIQQVKMPEDSLMFLDWKLLMKDLGAMMDFVVAQSKANADDEAGIKTIKSLMATLDVIDYQIVSAETEGKQEISRLVFKLQPEKMDSPLVKMVRNQKAFDKFDRFIPVDAKGFTMDSFIDMETVYRSVLEFVTKNVPNGGEGIAHWEQMLAGVGFDPKRDLFSWWGGEMISIDMPAAVVTPMSNADSVSMIRVKDSKIAAEKVNAAINGLKGILENKLQQTLLVSPAGEGLEGFQEVTHPMMAMFFRPVIGVKDEWLFIGTSGKAITRCLDVAAGKAPSILKNERFQKEGIVPKGPVCHVSFTDTSNTAQELGAALGMASMVGGMMTAGIPAEPGDPKAAKTKEIIQKIFGMVMKLSPVVAKIDFYSADATVTTWDGTWSRTERIVTYKAPGGDKNADASKKKE